MRDDVDDPTGTGPGEGDSSQSTWKSDAYFVAITLGALLTIVIFVASVGFGG
jgi:hypothetical protein